MSISHKFGTLMHLLCNSDDRFLFLANIGAYKRMSDDIYLKKMFRAKFKYDLDLDNPKTFNEKLQWLKLNDRKPIYTTMVDKYAAKKFVADIIGDEYIIPTLGVWDSAEEINFASLPEKFVLKSTHDSGGIKIVDKNKPEYNEEELRRFFKKRLKRSLYYITREWPYKDVKPRVIAEQYMEDSHNRNRLIDYKFFTFRGTPKLFMVNYDRGVSTKADYYDVNLNKLDFTWGYPQSNYSLKLPVNYEKMLELAGKLSLGTKELRVDFYECNGKLYFGELTFFDGSGFTPITPFDWDCKLGEYIDLNEFVERGIL